MAIATPAAAVISASTAFQKPAMASDVLADALDNANFLYLDWEPPLVDFCPITNTNAGDRGYTVPIHPSLDGLKYRVRFVILTGVGITTITPVVYESTAIGAGWASVSAPGAQAVAASSWVVLSFTTSAVAAASRVVQFVLKDADGPFYPSQIFLAPRVTGALVPFVAPYGVMPSGFTVFDDALLRGGAGVPICTEYLDRTLRNARSVIRDRRQCVFSCIQADAWREAPRFGAPPAITGSIAIGYWVSMGRSKCYIPHDGDTWIDVRTYAAVSAGADTDLIRVSVSSGDAVLLHADSTAIQTARLKVSGPVFDIDVSVSATAGNTTKLYAAVGLWRPGDKA